MPTNKEYEDDLNQRWANAHAAVQCYEMTNTYGRTPIELAKLRMDLEKARAEFHKVDSEMRDYVNKGMKDAN